jgi:23S rRNA (adenine2503-C2)-methyltransferase
MIGQVMTALNTLGEFSKPSEEKNVQTIVFMGQGEPFYNFKNVVKTLDFLSDPEGLCFSRKRMTISTSGVVPIIDKFSENPSLETVQLAISLHSIRDEIRDKLIPLNKQVLIKTLKIYFHHVFLPLTVLLVSVANPRFISSLSKVSSETANFV